MIEEHPLIGVGIGGPAAAPAASWPGSDRPTPNFVSHTTPLTVAAELGVVGAAAVRLAAGRRRAADRAGAAARPGARPGARRPRSLALFVHALFYSGFLEDPITWLVLAVGAGWLSWHEAQRSAAERSRERAATPA